MNLEEFFNKLIVIKILLILIISFQVFSIKGFCEFPPKPKTAEECNMLMEQLKAEHNSLAKEAIELGAGNRILHELQPGLNQKVFHRTHRSYNECIYLASHLLVYMEKMRSIMRETIASTYNYNERPSPETKFYNDNGYGAQNKLASRRYSFNNLDECVEAWNVTYEEAHYYAGILGGHVAGLMSYPKSLTRCREEILNLRKQIAEFKGQIKALQEAGEFVKDIYIPGSILRNKRK